MLYEVSWISCKDIQKDACDYHDCNNLRGDNCATRFYLEASGYMLAESRITK